MCGYHETGVRPGHLPCRHRTDTFAVDCDTLRSHVCVQIDQQGSHQGDGAGQGPVHYLHTVPIVRRAVQKGAHTRGDGVPVLGGQVQGRPDKRPEQL